MANIDEVLAAMPDTAAEAAIEYLTIDPVTRKITVPEASRIFGVTADEMAERKYFLCPRYVGDGLDLAGMFLTVYFRTATGYEDGYLVDDVAVNGEYVTFSWLLSESVTMHKGAVQFSVCADLPNTADKRRPDWNTTIATGEVLEGLDPDLGDVAGETSDVVAQLREMVTAQTAAVEATGATQVQEVRAAATTATAEAQAQIEAKGAATLATIPADYTTMAGKVNEQANAIKGHLSGEIVQASDVSPVEHYLGVKVRSKNHFIASKIGSTSKYTKNEDGTITVLAGQYSCPTGLQLKTLCPFLELGKTAVLSIDTDGLDFIYSNGVLRHGVPFVVTEKILDGYVAIYGAEENGADFETAHTIRYIQIEDGDSCTEYTPYIDPAGVTVTRCGKNLLPYPFHNPTTTINGATYTVNSNGSITVSGTPTDYGSITLYKGEPLAKSGLVVLSGMGTAKNVLFTVNIKYGDDLTESLEYSDQLVINLDDYPNATLWNIGMKRWANNTEMSGTAYPQIEAGEAATEYEPYKGTATAMPNESGTVTGLPSAAPTMTLLADTAGVTIDCTYNRDSNAVYAELLAKIAALGGTN